jgi:hypothetical protein
VVTARACEVRVDINAARHDDHPACVQRRSTIGEGGHDSSVFHKQIAGLAVHSVSRIVNGSPNDTKLGRAAHREAPRSWTATASPSALSTSVAERGPERGGLSSSGISSMRYAMPAS